MTTFNEMELSDSTLNSLKKLNFTNPTPIQEKAIPIALEGKDILGSAQTGTGKTAAFGLPLIENILKSRKNLGIIITPTRELATQVLKQIHEFLGQNKKIKTALLIGGDSISKQVSQIKRNPQIIVGTPGRINDHLKRGVLNIKQTNFLVLDETDRMLDMGFSVQIDDIMKYIDSKPQTLLFSATMPSNIMKIAKKYLAEPEKISVDKEFSVAEKIIEKNLSFKDSEKFDVLVKELKERDGTAIVFVKTKFSTEKIAKRLYDVGIDSKAIHGDLKQSKRERVINSFRNKKYNVLVATDVVARGLDIPHIEHVINYDLPQSPEDYIHRIGRTARAGAEGHALNFITPSETKKWRAIELLMDPSKKNTEMHISNKNSRRNSTNRRLKTHKQDHPNAENGIRFAQKRNKRKLTKKSNEIKIRRKRSF